MACAAALGLAALLLGGCSTASGESAGVASPSQPAVPAASPSPSAPAVLPSIDPGANPGLPPEWPSAIPGYPDGRLLSAVTSEDGRNVNGAWVADTTPQEAWAAMDARLRAAGFVTSAEAGGEDMLVEDANQRSDYYTRDGFEVNLVVLPGEQITILVNGSAL